MNVKELREILENMDDDTRIYNDTYEEFFIVFVSDNKPNKYIDMPLYCSECESTGLVDIEPDDVPHGTEGFWVSQHGARFFMTYCECDAGKWRSSQS